MIGQKQLENVECFNYLGSMLTNDGRCTREIKSRIAVSHMYEVFMSAFACNDYRSPKRRG